MTTRPTEADFADKDFARHPDGRVAMREPDPQYPWVTQNEEGHRAYYRDAEMARTGWSIIPTVPEWGDIPEDEQEAMVERAALEAVFGSWETLAESARVQARGIAREVLAAALTSPPARPEWAGAPAVLARRYNEESPTRVWANRGEGRWCSGANGARTEDLTDVTPLYPEGRAPEVGQ